MCAILFCKVYLYLSKNDVYFLIQESGRTIVLIKKY